MSLTPTPELNPMLPPDRKQLRKLFRQSLGMNTSKSKFEKLSRLLAAITGDWTKLDYLTQVEILTQDGIKLGKLPIWKYKSSMAHQLLVLLVLYPEFVLELLEDPEGTLLEEGMVPRLGFLREDGDGEPV